MLALVRRSLPVYFVLLACACAWGAVIAPSTAAAASTIDNSIVALDSGDEHTLGLTKGGRVLAWGRNFRGQLGDGTTFDRTAPVFVQGLPLDSAVVQIAAGDDHSMARTADGRVYTWGHNGRGQLGDGTTTNRLHPRRVAIPGGEAATFIDAGGSSYAVTAGGSLYAWGPAGAGQLGNQKNVQNSLSKQFWENPQLAKRRAVPLDPLDTPSPNTNSAAAVAFTDVEEVAAGYEHAVVLLGNGELWAFGAITQGQLGLNTGSVTSSGRSIGEKLNMTAHLPGCVVASLAAGGDSSYAVCENGKAYAWGSGGDGQLGISAGWNAASTRPQAVAGVTTAQEIVVGDNFMFVRLASGAVQGAGANSLSQLGASGSKHSTVVTLPNLQGATAIGAGLQFGVAVGADGDVRGWGHTDHGELAGSQARYHDREIQIPGLTGITDIAAGDDYSVAVDASGNLWAWGDNEFGTLADGTTTDRPTPAQIAGITAVTDIATGPKHVLAVSAGKVYAWGDNASGQLGDGTVTQRRTPTLVGGITGTVVGVDTGTTHSIAYTSTGVAYVWGSNLKGQLGNGTLGGSSTTAVAVALPGPVVEVAAGETVSVVRLSSGAIYTWGGNASTEIGAGIGTTTSIPTPTHANAGATWQPAASNALAVGAKHVLVLASNGDVWGWGDNDAEQLHVINRTRIEHATHVYPQFGLAGVTSLVSGPLTLFARTSSGALYGWGETASYQVGHGSYGDYTSITPYRVDLKPGAALSAIASGTSHTLVLRGGLVYGWGFTGDGALGFAQSRFTTTATVTVDAPTPALDTTVAASANGNRPSGGEIGTNGAPGSATTVQVQVRGAGSVRLVRSPGTVLEGECRSGDSTRTTDVGEVCAFTGVPVGQQLTVVTTPATGYDFTSFAGAPGTVCVGQTTCTFTVAAGQTLFAAFADTTPPLTEIFSKPADVLTTRTAYVTVSANEAGATFRCKLTRDGVPGVLTTCTSQVTYQNLVDAFYEFEVFATDVSGNVDPTPARHSWTVAVPVVPGPTLSPIAGIQSGAVLTQRAATVSWTVSGATGVTCKLNGAPALPCTSPYALADLVDGEHTLVVTATDAGGLIAVREIDFSVAATPAVVPPVDVPAPGGPAVPDSPSSPAPGGANVPAAPSDTAAPKLTITKQTCPKKLKGAKCAAFLKSAAAWRLIAGTVTDSGAGATGAKSVDVVLYTKVGKAFRVMSGAKLVAKPKLAAAQATVNAATVSGAAWKRAIPKLTKGTWTLRVRATDRAGNVTGWTTRTVKIA